MIGRRLPTDHIELFLLDRCIIRTYGDNHFLLQTESNILSSFNRFIFHVLPHNAWVFVFAHMLINMLLLFRLHCCHNFWVRCLQIHVGRPGRILMLYRIQDHFSRTNFVNYLQNANFWEGPKSSSFALGFESKNFLSLHMLPNRQYIALAYKHNVYYDVWH